MSYVLALDQGTTSSRSIIFDHEGSVVSIAQTEFRQIYPQSGWVEHDPEEIWRSQIDTAVEAMLKSGLSAKDIAAVGITNQRETTIVWDRATGRPVHNAIVWQDRRTSDLCGRLRSSHGALIRQKTGLEVDAYFSASKIAWLVENVSDVCDRAEAGELAFGTVDTWLLWKLTGGRHATDASNASRTLLFDIHTLRWDDELLDIFGVPRALLPEVRSSSEILGEIGEPGELRGIPIAGVAGDQQAALFGQACFAAGSTKNTYGTGCFMLQNIGGDPIGSNNGLLTTVGWKMMGDQTVYALEGSVFIGGAVVQWLRDSLGVISSASEIETLASTVDDNGGVFFVPAFAGLGTPHWNQEARGTIIGLTRGTGRAHIARAALESIAFQSADLLEAMQADSGKQLEELRVDGGASANNLLMQIQADLLQIPVTRARTAETTALGAAYFAGLAVGVWKSTGELAEHWQAGERFVPKMSASDALSLRSRWREAVERSLGWAN